jgi:hypothetical protein
MPVYFSDRSINGHAIAFTVWAMCNLRKTTKTPTPTKIDICSGTTVGARLGFPLHKTTRRVITMSIARTTEISASSSKGFEDAVQKGIKRFSKTIKHVEGAWVKEQKVVVSDGEVTEYRVTMKVTFVLDD